MRHLIDSTDLSVKETQEILNLALDIIENRTMYSHVCAGKKLATLFYEPSTRTRLSFTAAMMELGGNVLGFSDASTSSVSKGETVADTVRVVSAFADIIAMRHYKEGGPFVASQYSRIPVINAGDGGNAHPTQTLTDLLSIRRELGHLDNLTIGLCGDLKYGRTVHSLIKAMNRYEGVKFVLIAPAELRLPDHIKNLAPTKCVETATLEEALPTLDVLYMTRVQQERFANKDDYERLKDSFVLDARKMQLAKEKMIVLHPLPRVKEISPDVDSDSRAAYFRQVENGKFVRMALIYTLLHKTTETREHSESLSVTEEPCTNRRCITATEPVERLSYEDHDGKRRCAYCNHVLANS
ncbi:MAG: aspartate carbamoyltransferase [Muribaculaceae bacterium]|nr:aspartate carbamoyltransferase [Muribaculaceae bacterium]